MRGPSINSNGRNLFVYLRNCLYIRPCLLVRPSGCLVAFYGRSIWRDRRIFSGGASVDARPLANDRDGQCLSIRRAACMKATAARVQQAAGATSVGSLRLVGNSPESQLAKELSYSKCRQLGSLWSDGRDGGKLRVSPLTRV